jgi:PDZ domain
VEFCVVPHSYGNIKTVMLFLVTTRFKLHMKKLIAALILATTSHIAIAQMAPGLPPAYFMLLGMTGKAVARCEVQDQAYTGETAKFLFAVEAASPGILMRQKAEEVEKRLLKDVRMEKGTAPEEKCAEIIATSKQLPEKIACHRENYMALENNRTIFSRLSLENINMNQGAQTCIGMFVGRPGETILGDASCSTPATKFLAALIEPGGSADAAGIMEGDEVISVDGRSIKYPLDFEVSVLFTAPGQKVKVVTRRFGKDTAYTLSTGSSIIRPGEYPFCEMATAKPR